MYASTHRGARRASAVALRIEPERESRFTVVLVALLGFATMSILATTSALSRHHAEAISVELQR